MKGEPVRLRVPPGLEQHAADELRAVGCRPAVVPGGVTLPWEDLPATLAHARIGSGVTVTVGSVRLDGLPDALRGIPWKRFLNPHQLVEVVLRGPRGRGLDRKCAAVIARGAARRAVRPGRMEPLRVWLIHHKGEARVEVAVEAARELWRRGWRTQPGKAPLRENLAAGLLRAAGWRPGEPLVDPMCGSGTFGVEAALIALGRPAGAHGRFAAELWPELDHAALARERRRIEPSGAAPQVWLSDRDRAQVEAARQNLARARVDRHVHLDQVAFAERAAPAARGLLITNPPYGDRLGATERTYHHIGDTLRAGWVGWRFAIVLPDARLARALPGPVDASLCVPHGGKKVWLALGTVRQR